MGIDPNSVGATIGPDEVSWSDRDTMLYAIGVGAGLDELAFATENSHDTPQQVLPTYGVIVCGAIGVLKHAGDINWGKLVHGSQSVRLVNPLPPSWPASRSRSCTGCAPTGSPGARCCTACATATRRASAR